MAHWIKFDTALPDKPEVLRMARILGVERDLVVGKLLRLWAWFDGNSVDGTVDGVVDADVDALVGIDGFCEVLTSVGWYVSDAENERGTIPNFDRHNGETAKKRAEKNARQARWRSKNEAFEAASTGASTGASTSASTREDKIRIDKNIKRRKEPDAASPHPPGLDTEAWETWTAYRKSVGKPIKSASMLAAMKQMADLGQNQHQAVEQSIANGWQGLFAPKVAVITQTTRSQAGRDEFYKTIRELTQ